MKISILTLFPEMFAGPFDYSIIKRAKEKKLLEIEFINIRDFSPDKHKTVDDRPYGGGEGMILRVDIIDQAIKFVLRNRVTASTNSRTEEKKRVILLDPVGKTFDQKLAKKLSKYDHLILVCGHYEGVDERVRKLVDEEISIGDYVLTGGEIPSIVLTDSIARLIPGVLKTKEAVDLESFSESLLEYPQYTRPRIFQKRKVPSVLLSGNHSKIKKWQKIEAEKRTKRRRPDLISTQRG